LRHYSIICALFFIFPLFLGTTWAEQKTLREITLEDAIQLFLTKNPELAKKQLEIEKARGHEISAGLWANPDFSFYREDLENGSKEYSENVFSMDYSFDFSGQRRLRKRVAQSARNVADSHFEYEKNTMIFEVKRLYIMAALTKKKLELLERTEEVFRKAVLTGENRFKEGAISGIDHLRLQIEWTHYKNELSNARIGYERLKRQLIVVINPLEPDIDYEPIDDLAHVSFNATFEQLLEIAKKNRSDLKRAEHLLKGSQGALQLIERERFPLFQFTGGYKTQSDDLKGPIFGVSFSLPLFNRNQGKIITQQIELLQLKKEKTILEKLVEQEISELLRRIEIMESQLEHDRELLPRVEKILDISQFAYEEGQISLLELLDAARSYYELKRAHNQLLANHQMTYFEMEKSISASLSIN
jgi:cobalt-zinc-cadmium efflux system outer membrane protein